FRAGQGLDQHARRLAAGGPECTARRRGERPAHLFHQQRHLVGDQAHIAVAGREHGQAGTVADRHDQQQPLPHLDHRLGDRAALEHLGRAVGQAGQARGHRGQLVRPVLGEPGRERQRQAIGGHDDGMGRGRYPLDEIRDEPVQVLRRRSQGTHVASLLVGGSSSDPATRAFLIPCWKLARRCLVCSADLAVSESGAAASGPTPPGTRFWFGTRLGRPAPVNPADTGACATSAARHPSSDGDDQLAEAGSGAGADRPIERLPRRNQSDSTASKMGSRFSGPVTAAGGTITCGVAVAPSPSASGPSMTRAAGAAAAANTSSGSGLVPVSAAPAGSVSRSGPAGSRRGGRAGGTPRAVVGRPSGLLTASPLSIQLTAALFASGWNRRRVIVAATLSRVITSSGSHTSAASPPVGAGRSRTRMPCRAASRATTNRPIRRDTATSTTGGLSSRQLACAISSAPMPTPWSVMSSSTPPLLRRCPDTYTWVSSGENAVAFSTISAARCTTSLTAWPTTTIPGWTLSTTRSYCSISEMAARSTSTSGTGWLHRLVTSWPARTSRFSELRRMRVARWSSWNRLDSRPASCSLCSRESISESWRSISD